MTGVQTCALPISTVFELPPAFQAVLPETVPEYVFKLIPHPERIIPEVFWYSDGLTCSLIAQNHRAPLVFVIAGTGARYNSPKMQILQKQLYQAGFHVLSISSPTSVDFIIHASSSSVPGHLAADANDLYQVMQLAWQRTKNRLEVSDFLLTGYSLGGQIGRAHV